MTDLPPGATGSALADGHGLGDRFLAYRGSPAGWTRARDLLLGDGLTPELDRLGSRLGTTGPAVAAVLLFEQYALRLTAAMLAAFHRDGMLLDARPDQVLLSPPEREGPLRLAFAAPPEPAAGIAAVRGRLLGEGLLPIAEHLHRRTRAGRRTLRGTIANAVAANYLHLSWPEPDPAQLVGAARAFLEPDGLAGLVGIEDVDVDGESWMYTDRNTCCLAFRTARNAERDVRYCLTCPCMDRTDTRSMFVDATRSFRQRHPVAGAGRSDAAGSPAMSDSTGDTANHEVTADDTAVALGSGDVDVLGTPRLIAWLEAATVAAAREHLEPGRTSVGTAVRVRHRRPTPVGGTVAVAATLQDGPTDGKLRFAVEAHDGNGTLVADGEIDRVVVEREGFGQG